MRISDWSSDVCSSDLPQFLLRPFEHEAGQLLAEGVVDLLQGVAGDGEGFRERPAHADGLGALSRKDESHGHGRLLREYGGWQKGRSEEHTSELQSLMRISYAVFCLKKKKQQYITNKKRRQRQP